MPTALLFSLLFSMAGVLPHLLSSEVQLPATEFIPGVGGVGGQQFNLNDSLPVHFQEQTEIIMDTD